MTPKRTGLRRACRSDRVGLAPRASAAKTPNANWISAKTAATAQPPRISQKTTCNVIGHAPAKANIRILSPDALERFTLGEAYALPRRWMLVTDDSADFAALVSLTAPPAGA